MVYVHVHSYRQFRTTVDCGVTTRAWGEHLIGPIHWLGSNLAPSYCVNHCTTFGYLCILAIEHLSLAVQVDHCE